MLDLNLENMDVLFYLAASITLVSTFLVITRHTPVHALLYLIVSFLSLSMVFFVLGAPFAAVLEIIIYAGAIMVLFIFVVMLLNLGKQTAAQEKEWLKPRIWIGPALLTMVLFAEITYFIVNAGAGSFRVSMGDPKEVALVLFRSYMIGVELAAMLLMAGVVGAAHIGKHKKLVLHRFLKEEGQTI